MNNIKPIDAYFAQGLRGNHSWWTWLAGFWFAVMFWAFCQIIIGLPMFGAMFFADAEAVQTMMSEMTAGTGAAPSTLKSLLGASLFMLPPIAVLLFCLRGQFESGGTGRKVAMWTAAACALISGYALIDSMVNQPDGANDLLTAFIPKSVVVYACLLLTFPPLVFGLWLVQKFVHHRAFKPLFTAAKKFRWKRVFVSMGIFWAIAAIVTVIGHMAGLNTVTFVFNPDRFFMYAIVSLLFIPLQSATEEIMLRGYMNQGLGKYIKNPWIVFIITSGLFASLHLGNPEAVEGAENGKLLLTMSGYFLFGIFACILTYIDGGLESAIGVHAANNLYASIVLGYDNSALPTPTIMNTTLNPQTDVIVMIISMAVVCLILWKIRKPLDADMDGVDIDALT